MNSSRCAKIEELLAETLEVLRLERQRRTLPKEPARFAKLKGYEVFDRAAELGVFPKDYLDET